MTFTLGFVTGATPDKWASRWRDRYREPIDLVPLTEADQERAVREGEVEMALVRLPIESTDLHLVPLYEERPVVVLSVEHELTLLDEVELADLAEEQLVRPHRSGWRPAVDQLEWPAMSEKDAVATVAAGSGVVVLPMSVARLYHRKDVTHRVVNDLESTRIGLTWLIDRDDDRTQAFVGITRGRTRNSSRA